MTRTHEASEDVAQGCLEFRDGVVQERREPQRGVLKSTYKLPSNPWLNPELYISGGDSTKSSLKQSMEHTHTKMSRDFSSCLSQWRRVWSLSPVKFEALGKHLKLCFEIKEGPHLTSKDYFPGLKYSL